MTAFPTIQLRTQPAQIAIETTPGKLDIHQQLPDMQIHTEPLKLEIQKAAQTPPGDMVIDQSRAREALGIGSTFWFVGRMADEAARIAQEGVARIVEEGNQAADIAHDSGNAFAEIARSHAFDGFSPVQYEGPFEVDPVDIHYTAVKPEINFTGPNVAISIEPHPADIQYTAGKVDVYLAQKPEFQMIPPQIDLKV